MKKIMQHFLKVANQNIGIENIQDDLLMDLNSGSRHFFCNDTFDNHFSAVVNTLKQHEFPKGQEVYRGEPWGDLQMPYQWTILQIDGCWAVEVNFQGSDSIHHALAVIDLQKREIRYFLDVPQLPFVFDPFLYPLGILVFIYLALFNKGLVIHASGVQDGEKGYLFTGLSGIGKSTMAQLWQAKGAVIINDDRLAVMPDGDGFSIHNTPMPYYQDYPKSSRLHGIFLLKQSNENYCLPLKGASAMMRVMANCMQHFHTPELVQQHLSIVEAITHQIPVFELGFKPDGDIVDLIRNLK